MTLEEIHTVSEIDFMEANIALKSNGIVYVLFKDHCVLDIDLQLKLLDAYNEITDFKKTPFMFFAGENVTITKEARDNATNLEDKSPLSATAIIISNLAYKLIAEFFIKFNKPKRPYKIFKNEKEAVEWLKQFESIDNKN
ncbi:MAG: hypothetical protein SFY56_15425 [Bacteroidota bacterium]|nr:hypothetical protein [Bacteroidota bacterium]